MRTPLVVSILAALGLASGLVARQRPDFAGTWVATTEPPAGREPAPSAVLGSRLAIRHDGNRIVLTRPVQDDVMAVTFPLDATPTSYRVPGRVCEADREVTETAAWDGNAIALTIVRTTAAGGGNPLTLSAKRILRRESDLLVVEGTRTVNGVTSQVGTVYKRSADGMPSPRPAIAVTTAPAGIESVRWIGGTWIGTTNGVTTEERWTPSASGSMLAVARTLRGPQMSEWEFLCIVERNGSLVYTAMPNGRTVPTDFALTTLTADGATFENPGHDYPKSIRYSLEPDGTLKTTTAGAPGSRTVSVGLKRQ